MSFTNIMTTSLSADRLRPRPSASAGRPQALDLVVVPGCRSEVMHVAVGELLVLLTEPLQPDLHIAVYHLDVEHEQLVRLFAWAVPCIRGRSYDAMPGGHTALAPLCAHAHTCVCMLRCMGVSISDGPIREIDLLWAENLLVSDVHICDLPLDAAAVKCVEELDD